MNVCQAVATKIIGGMLMDKYERGQESDFMRDFYPTKQQREQQYLREQLFKKKQKEHENECD